MDTAAKFHITEKEKNTFIDALASQLCVLRAKAGIAQEELARLIGVSRQTYGAIERRSRRMSWGTYLSLILFFDYNKDTHQAIRSLSAFPHELINRFNDGTGSDLITSVAGDDPAFADILDRLDERALHAINTVIMLEYARCTELPGDAVIKSFDGRQFNTQSLARDASVRQALKQLKSNGT